MSPVTHVPGKPNPHSYSLKPSSPRTCLRAIGRDSSELQLKSPFPSYLLLLTFPSLLIFSFHLLWVIPIIENRELLFSKNNLGTSLVVQWMRIHLSMQGTQVQFLVWKDSTRPGATEPMSHNYWAHVLQLLKPTGLEPTLHNKTSHHNEKPSRCNKE